MTAQQKPLRFLFSKYAALAPNGTSPPGSKQQQPYDSLRSLKVPGWSKSGSLGDLHLLASDISQSKLDRIHIFLALSEVPGQSPASVMDSSVGSSSILDTGSCGQSRGTTRAGEGGRGSRVGSPARFRSRSQEFESIYRLAASRCSPEFLKNGFWHTEYYAQKTSYFQNSISHQGGQSAMLINNNKQVDIHGKRTNKKQSSSENTNKGESAKSNDISVRGEDTASTRDVLQLMIEERRHNNIDGCGSLRPAHQLSFSYQDLNNMIDGKYPISSRRQRHPSAKHNKGLDEQKTYFTQEQRVLAGQLPRCNSLSTVDADRLDSSCYHYLLERLSSDNSSGILTSEATERASSKASARAQRPSTSGTEATAQRLRNLHTRTTDLSSPPSQSRQQPILPPGLPGMSNAPLAPSSSIKSPELPWPPCYALIPSWPSYEDIQTLNGPGDNRRNRRTKDCEKYRKIDGIWEKGPQTPLHLKNKIHIVPSHTTTICEKCNLFNTQCAQHTSSMKSKRPTSPKNAVENLENVLQGNNYHKQPLPQNQITHNRKIKSNGQSKYYFPPATANTNSSMKVNIGIKEPFSATISKAHIAPTSKEFQYGQCLSNPKPLVNGNLDRILNVDSISNHRHHFISSNSSSVPSSSNYSDRLKRQNQPQKSRSSVSYSWDRASKVSFVNTII
ncbi:hypothetical protein PoB_000753400 [Plakobranchus ocellatus]|uniref:Uncharacterized protein n=1 Tax=Plakobranchus ocellatus TaxID=259542 RepID=A0AAV3YDC5_9GAST|nr:hypothetical protein PoB_000753400 [Plakobranchus ocellatus]